MKVLFITINNRKALETEEIIFVTPPINLMYLAQGLIEMGVDCRIVDTLALNLTTEETIREIRKYDPDVVCASLYSWDLDVSYTTLQKIKETFPHIFLVLGGHHPSYLPEKTLEDFPFADLLLRGEGDKAIIELTQGIGKNVSFDKLPNISYRHNGRVVNNRELPLIQDLDEIPIPSQNLIDIRLYYSKLFKKNPLGVVITSRGCPYRCSFCSRLNEGFRVYRERSPENTFKEIKEIYDAGARSLDIYDDTFTVNSKRCFSLLEMIRKEKMDLELRIRTRVDCTDREMLEKLSKAGTKTISYGVESGNREVLRLVNKGITLEMAEKAFKDCHAEGMESCGFFIVGLPGDTPSTINDTISFCRKLNPTYPSISRLTPNPNTWVYEHSGKYGQIVGEWSPFKPEPYLKLPWMKSRKDLDYYFKLAYDKTVRRPGFIAQTLIRCIREQNWNQLSYLARNSMKDLRDIKGFSSKRISR